MSDYGSGPSIFPRYQQVAIPVWQDAADVRVSPKVAKKTNIAASMVQPLARAAILGSSTAAVAIGCIALAAGAAFPPTAFIALGIMAAGVVLLAAGKMMSKERSIAKNTVKQAFYTAGLPVAMPAWIAVEIVKGIGTIVIKAVVIVAQAVIPPMSARGREEGLALSRTSVTSSEDGPLEDGGSGPVNTDYSLSRRV